MLDDDVAKYQSSLLLHVWVVIDDDNYVGGEWVDGRERGDGLFSQWQTWMVILWHETERDHVSWMLLKDEKVDERLF
jgi:hypothetical protein